MMCDLHVPDRLHADVTREVDRLHRQAEDPNAQPANRTTTPSFMIKRTRFRGIAAAACLVLATGVGTTALALGLPAFLSTGTDPGIDEPSAVTTPATGNFFSLAAYATENPAGESGRTVGLSLDSFHQSGYSGSELDALSGEERSDFDWLTSDYIFDMTCTGENITSITYELVGDDLYFEVYNEEEFLRAHGVYGDDDPAVKSGYTITDSTTFTVDYENQDLSEDNIKCTINIPFHMEGETKALSEQMKQAVGEEFKDLSLEFTLAVGQDAAQKLAQSQLKLTATFSDGTTQTKTYVIAPVEGFEQIYRPYLEAQDDAAEAVRNGQTDAFDNLPEEPTLFTITEVSAA